MKLTDIILERQEIGTIEKFKGYNVTKTEDDPETGGETWEIEHLTRSNISRTLNDLISTFKRLLLENRGDTKLKEFLDYLLHFRKIYKMYMSKKYGKF